MIIAVLNQRGGVGKSTHSIHLAAVFAQHAPPVLLIDADPQASALDWAASRQAAPQSRAAKPCIWPLTGDSFCYHANTQGRQG